MGNGLKDQWGVTDPAKAGSDKQAQEFQAAFKGQIACINGHLQYTSANAEAARHAPLEGRRDALYPAFQSALAQIDRTNPIFGPPNNKRVNTNFMWSIILIKQAAGFPTVDSLHIYMDGK